MVVVAQLVRVSVCGTECRGFESRLPPQKINLLGFQEGLFLQLILFTIFLSIYWLLNNLTPENIPF